MRRTQAEVTRNIRWDPGFKILKQKQDISGKTGGI
jgi:hypothetical protein